MSTQKRKLEEYLDPDYATVRTNGAESTANESERPTKKAKPAEDRAQRMRQIIHREFSTELVAKEQEIDEIERRLTDAKQLLAKVRYAVVYNYYTRKNLVYSAFDLKTMDKNAADDETSSNCLEDTLSHSVPSTLGPDPEKLQPAIHPSLKKLLGKRPIDYDELLKVRPVRQAAKTATQNFNKVKKTTKMSTADVNRTIPSQDDEDSSEASSAPSEIKVPRYIAPTMSTTNRIEQVNSARGRNQFRHLIVVGNTSKFIGDEEKDSATNVTHKWLVYISAKTSIPIEKIVSKARFFLHESYRPNDIVEVQSPPFQIAKRGWGEFPLRVQLYFHSHLQQKPIQILHNLVLDKKHSGLQTMGAETVVELYLNLSNADEESMKTKTIETEPSTSTANQSTSHKQTVHRINVKMEPELHIFDTPQKSSIAIVSDPPPSAAPSIPQVTTQIKSTPIVSGKRYINCIDKTGKMSLIEMVVDPNNPKVMKMILPAALRTTMPQSTTTQFHPSNTNSSSSPVAQTPPHNRSMLTNNRMAIVKKPSASVQQSLLRPSISLLKSSAATAKPAIPTATRGLKMITVNNLCGMENRYFNVFMPTDSCDSDTDIEIPRGKKFVINTQRANRLAEELETKFLNCQQFTNVTAGVVWLLKRLPLITPKANQREYKDSFPFMVSGIGAYESMAVPKQRSYEWLRAKLVSRFISKHALLQSNAWTTKQIIQFARTFGYSPMPCLVSNSTRDDSELKNIIKTELMREHLQNDTISFNRSIVDWIGSAERRLDTENPDKHHIAVAAEEIVIVNDDEGAADERVCRPSNGDNVTDAGKTYLPMETEYLNESSWITEICRDAQIRLQSEEVVKGAIYPAVQTVLSIAMRSFVEDLLRRSAAHSTLRTSDQSTPGVCINSDDIQRAITTTKQFDFLTNKRFGVGEKLPP